MRADKLGGEVGGVGWRWKSRVLWAPVNMHEQLGECKLGPKKLEISSANPIHPLPHLMYLPASKTLRMWPYKSLVHRWFYEHENPLKNWIAGPRWGWGRKVGSRRGRREGAELEGENKGWRGAGV